MLFDFVLAVIFAAVLGVLVAVLRVAATPSPPGDVDPDSVSFPDGVRSALFAELTEALRWAGLPARRVEGDHARS